MRHVLALFLAFSLAVSGCPRPTPGPEAPVSVSSPLATAERVIDVLGWVLPGIRAVVGLLRLPPEATLVITRAVDVAQGEALPRLQRSIDVFRARGGETGQCDIYAASGGVREALLAIVETSTAAGFRPPPEVVQVLHSVGGLVDGFAQRCEADAGFRSVSAASLRSVAGFEEAASQRGVVLAPFPVLPRPSR